MKGEHRRWQCARVAWGDKYSVADINQLVRSVRAASQGPDRFVLLSDRDRPGLDPAVEVRAIPDWFMNPEFRRGGSLAKLCLFEAGLLPQDMPAI
jgi:hypothetical protein